MPDEERTEVTTEETTEQNQPKPFITLATEKEHDEYMERMLGERLKRKDKKLEHERAEAERKAREQALKDQEDWKRLAEERTNTIAEKDQRINELASLESERDSATERTQALEERLRGLIRPQLEAVPELFRPFVEGMTVEEQAEWLQKNADKLGATHNGGARPAGSRPTGRAQTVPKGEADKEARESQRISRVSSI